MENAHSPLDQQIRLVNGFAANIGEVADLLNLPYERAHRFVVSHALGSALERNRVLRKRARIASAYFVHVAENGGVHPTSNDLANRNPALYSRIMRAYGGMRAFRETNGITGPGDTDADAERPILSLV